MAGILHKSNFLDHWCPLLMIFFKIVCYFANCARGKCDTLRILGYDEAIYHLEFFFINTYYLQPLCSCNGKNFLKKIKKPSEIFWIQERWRTFRTPCIYDISRIVSYNWFFFLLFDGTKVVTSRADLAINEQSWDFFRRYRNKIRF